ncbi:MAG: translation elongation factor Ts [Planctomycetota bacterium]
MSIDAKLVAELRKRTALPMMKCKAALVEADGDIELAAINLRKQGVKAAEKVAHRELKEGRVFSTVGKNGACAVSLLCQTDFVARNNEIVSLGNQLAGELMEKAPADQGTGDSIADFAMADGKTLKEISQDFALKIRENIQVGDYARFNADNSHVGVYMHHDEKVAVVVELAGENATDNEDVKTLANELGMHITWNKDVKALTRDGIDQAWIAQEREIFAAQVQDQPEERREKIAEGKLSKRLKDVVLLEQPFIKDDKKSVAQAIKEVGDKIGGGLELRRFARVSA